MSVGIHYLLHTIRTDSQHLRGKKTHIWWIELQMKMLQHERGLFLLVSWSHCCVNFVVLWSWTVRSLSVFTQPSWYDRTLDVKHPMFCMFQHYFSILWVVQNVPSSALLPEKGWTSKIHTLKRRQYYLISWLWYSFLLHV